MSVPVISIGNLTMGGSGKTPVVRHIAEALTLKNFRPAIVSRGYRGSSKSEINVVSDGQTVFMDATQAGDEPVLLAESLPGIPVVTGVLRSLPCRFAIDNFGCDLLILDDGFQHLRVIRDIDIVLFNAAAPLGNCHVFPGGDMREPLSALRRADAFLMTGICDNLKAQIEGFQRLLMEKHPHIPVFSSSIIPIGFRNQGREKPIPMLSVPSPVYGFCGIASPDRFKSTLEQTGIQLCGLLSFRDHQIYDQNLIDHICISASRMGARALVTTEKDIVKLRSLDVKLPLYSLEMKVKLDDVFSEFIFDRLSSLAT